MGNRLFENGAPCGAVVVGADADEFHRFVAEELQGHLERLSGGRLPIVTDAEQPLEAPHGPASLILVGSPDANAAVRRLADRGAVDFTVLKAEGGYLLKSVAVDGRAAIVAGGNDPTGTMYAAYELLERLGIVFQLSNDVVPECKPTLDLPDLDLAVNPARKYRGVHVWHGYSWYMGLDEYRHLIDQLAKLKMNVLQFAWGMGAAWIRLSYRGVQGELTTTLESGHLAIGKDSRSWGRSVHTTTGTRADLRIGADCYDHERLCAPEFRDVQSEEDAYRVAIPFLREIIRHAHRRQVQVRLVTGELPLRPAQPGHAERQGRSRPGTERELQLPALLRGGRGARRSGRARHLGAGHARDHRDLPRGRLLRLLGARAQPGLRRPAHAGTARRVGGDSGAHPFPGGDPRHGQPDPPYAPRPGV